MIEVALPLAGPALSTLVDDVQNGGPAVITQDGRPAAVVISYDEWQRLTGVPSFGDLLMSSPLEDGDLTPRLGSLRDSPV